MLSNKAKYAVKALLYLARRHGKDPVLIGDLAVEERIPKKFLESILLELKNHGLLQSKKGKGGGYQLSKNPDLIALGEVIRIADGPIAPLSCVSQSSYQRCEECPDEATCGLRIVMKDVRDATARIVDGVSLKDMLERVDAAVRGGKGTMYYI
ncbi:MAG: Rrf2 family transcriptional regulator [Planctomycetes bacterium]|nr:Rrf2 family transcriptional regulator [Planctomycetota bacterium]